MESFCLSVPFLGATDVGATEMFREKFICDGAGDGNRTRDASLEGWSFTTKQHPQGGKVATVLSKPADGVNAGVERFLVEGCA